MTLYGLGNIYATKVLTKVLKENVGSTFIPPKVPDHNPTYNPWKEVFDLTHNDELTDDDIISHIRGIAVRELDIAGHKEFKD